MTLTCDILGEDCGPHDSLVFDDCRWCVDCCIQFFKENPFRFTDTICLDGLGKEARAKMEALIAHVREHEAMVKNKASGDPSTMSPKARMIECLTMVPCPSCAVHLFDKDEACLKASCYNCGARFCYLCMGQKHCPTDEANGIRAFVTKEDRTDRPVYEHLSKYHINNIYANRDEVRFYRRLLGVAQVQKLYEKSGIQEDIESWVRATLGYDKATQTLRFDNVDYLMADFKHSRETLIRDHAPIRIQRTYRLRNEGRRVQVPDNAMPHVQDFARHQRWIARHQRRRIPRLPPPAPAPVLQMQPAAAAVEAPDFESMDIEMFLAWCEDQNFRNLPVGWREPLKNRLLRLVTESYEQDEDRRRTLADIVDTLYKPDRLLLETYISDPQRLPKVIAHDILKIPQQVEKRITDDEQRILSGLLNLVQTERSVRRRASIGAKYSFWRGEHQARAKPSPRPASTMCLGFQEHGTVPRAEDLATASLTDLQDLETFLVSRLPKKLPVTEPPFQVTLDHAHAMLVDQGYWVALCARNSLNDIVMHSGEDLRHIMYVNMGGVSKRLIHFLFAKTEIFPKTGCHVLFRDPYGFYVFMEHGRSPSLVIPSSAQLEKDVERMLGRLSSVGRVLSDDAVRAIEQSAELADRFAKIYQDGSINTAVFEVVIRQILSSLQVPAHTIFVGQPQTFPLSEDDYVYIFHSYSCVDSEGIERHLDDHLHCTLKDGTRQILTHNRMDWVEGSSNHSSDLKNYDDVAPYIRRKLPEHMADAIKFIPSQANCCHHIVKLAAREISKADMYMNAFSESLLDHWDGRIVCTHIFVGSLDQHISYPTVCKQGELLQTVHFLEFAFLEGKVTITGRLEKLDDLPSFTENAVPSRWRTL